MSEPSDAERPVPPVPGGQTAPPEHEVAIDLAAFLPEGAELAGPDPAATAPEAPVDPWDTGAPEPEVPAWALDDPPAAAPDPTPSVADEPTGPSATPIAAAGPADALDRIDQELAAVDDALVALDAGTPEESPLLRDLLGR